MGDILDKLQKFITMHSEAFLIAWASFLGISVRLVFYDKREGQKVTFTLFASRWLIAIFVGWLASGWISSHPELKEWYGQIISICAVISYEIVTIIIKDVPQMISNYFKKKYSVPDDTTGGQE